MDVDWQNNESFASCSTDKTILVCKLNEKNPTKKFIGHTVSLNIEISIVVLYTLVFENFNAVQLETFIV